MAAVTALLDILEPGDHIVATDDLYGGTIRLMESICKKNGIKTTFVETDKVEKCWKSYRKKYKNDIYRNSNKPNDENSRYRRNI